MTKTKESLENLIAQKYVLTTKANKLSQITSVLNLCVQCGVEDSVCSSTDELENAIVEKQVLISSMINEAKKQTAAAPDVTNTAPEWTWFQERAQQYLDDHQSDIHGIVDRLKSFPIRRL